MEDQYFTIDKAAHSEIKVKGSRFIGHVALTETRDEAEAFITAINKQHHSATHNCTAYRVGLGDASAFRYSDDGEPSGTAGKPIMDMIDGRDLTQVTCVVTRYYGGTKLGCGGLVRAYGQCAAEALDSAGIKTRYIMQSIQISYPYDLTGVVMHVVERFEGKILASDYSESARQTVGLKRSKVDPFAAELIEATAGKAGVTAEEPG